MEYRKFILHFAGTLLLIAAPSPGPEQNGINGIVTEK
jgi:hypothetical protein